MSALIDSTYWAVTSRLPLPLRETARNLLFTLGLAPTPKAGWADVFQLAPSLDLPLFALPDGLPVDAQTLMAFRRAHHCACFYSVLVDRLADQQAASTAELQALADHFLSQWRRSLAEAAGERAFAAWAVDQGARALRLGATLERVALSRRRMSLRRYGHGILLKLGWASIASESLLRHRAWGRQLEHFRRAFNLLAIALQVIDDAEDRAEDTATRGANFPSVLGFPPTALFTAGTLLTRTAATAAAQGGFSQFARWLTQRHRELDKLRARHVQPMDNLAGLVICSSLESLCLCVATRIHGPTGATTSPVSSD
jgi:hypothetical protein